MNGRCHKDALDRAEDICELCGNQFCASCLLYPRGHRNAPTCKTCALENSGLRGGRGSKSAMSKREYKKLKKQLLELLETVEEPEPALEAFELTDPSAFDTLNELDRRIEEIEMEPPVDILAPADATPPPPPSEPPAPYEAPAPAFVERTPPPPAPTPVAEAAPSKADDFGPVDTSVNPLAIDFGERPASAPRHVPEEQSAAELLARLKADEPIESQFNQPSPRPATPGPAFAADPFAAPTPTPTAGAASAPPPSSIEDPFAATSTTDPFAAPPPAAAPPSPSPMSATPGAHSAPAPKTAAWTPPAPPPRGSNLDAMAGGPAPGEGTSPPVATAPAPTAPAPTTPATTAPNPTAAPSDPAPSDAAPQVERRADTDAAGQWIPPSLRGMAAPDERDPLPKRR